MTDARALGADESTFVAAARSGDAGRFAHITERHRHELQVHCYRVLHNPDDPAYRLSNITVRHIVDGTIAELT